MNTRDMRSMRAGPRSGLGEKAKLEDPAWRVDDGT